MPANALSRFRLDGRVCFLSGATGHLGPQMAEILAAAGAHVYINARSADNVARLVDALEGQGLQASAAPFDINDLKAVEKCLQRIDRAHGRLDVIVHNATAGRPGMLEDIAEKDFAEVYRTNVTAAFQLVKAALPMLRKAAQMIGGASAICISSMYGSVSPDPSIYGSSGANNPPSYGPAKSALIQLTRYLACHLAPENIRVNCISPGPFPAKQFLERDPEFGDRLRAKVPMRRTGDPAELQGPLLFLASDASSYVTGINLPVDGGWTAW